MRRKERIAVEIIVGAAVILGVFAALRQRAGPARSLWPRGRVSIDSGYHEVMGTFARVVTVAMDEDTAKECARKALEQLELVDELMSGYKEDSEISVVNREGFARAVRVSEATFEVLERSVEYSRLTAGAFDVTVGPLVELWRAAGEANRRPEEGELQEARAKVGWGKMVLDANDLSVRFLAEGMRVDLGGIAKGYAIDAAVAAIQEGGAVGAMVDLGGDIRCFGAPAAGRERWLVGLQDPRKASDVAGGGEILLTLKLVDAAVATSGDYRRFVLVEGEKHSHIIDPAGGQTGGAAGRGLLSSVTVIAEPPLGGLDADALATAVSVMGAEAGLALVEELGHVEAIVISLEGGLTLAKTSGAERYVK